MQDRRSVQAGPPAAPFVSACRRHSLPRRHFSSLAIRSDPTEEAVRTAGGLFDFAASGVSLCVDLLSAPPGLLLWFLPRSPQSIIPAKITCPFALPRCIMQEDPVRTAYSAARHRRAGAHPGVLRRIQSLRQTKYRFHVRLVRTFSPKAEAANADTFAASAFSIVFGIDTEGSLFHYQPSLASSLFLLRGAMGSPLSGALATSSS